MYEFCRLRRGLSLSKDPDTQCAIPDRDKKSFAYSGTRRKYCTLSVRCRGVVQLGKVERGGRYSSVRPLHYLDGNKTLITNLTPHNTFL